MDVQNVPRDLAATRQAFAKLQTTQNDQLGSIIEIQRAVGATDLDVDAVMRVICTRTQVLTHAEAAAILILDGDGFELRVATGFLEDEIGARVPLVGTQPGWMHLHDQSGLLGDAKTDPRAGQLARRTGMRSGITVRLCHREQKIGQLIVVSRQPGAFTQVDVERLERLSDILSIALVHAAEFETKGQQVEALARFETIYQSAAIGITLVSPLGRYLDANPAFQLMSGFSMDELALMSPFDQTHPDDVASIEESIRSLSTGMREKTDLEVRFFHKDGRLRWGHITTTVQCEPGGAPQFSISMIEDITERKEAEEQLTYLAYNDGHTGLANRSAFTKALEASIARARRLGLAVGVIEIDLDYFRLVNDGLGYLAGDELLVQIAARLRDSSLGTELVARQSGDEFLLLLCDPADGPAKVCGIEAVASRIHELFAEPFTVEGVDFTISGSLGVATFPRDAADWKTLLSHADVAMHRSKSNGPGGTVVFSSSHDDPMRRLRMATQLRKAVALRSWELLYQPVVDLADGHIEGVEALIRGRAGNGDLIPPNDFISLAEDIGAIGAIGDWVIDEMARQMRAWNDAGLHLDVGLNVSPRQLLSTRFAEQLVHKLTVAGIDLRRVVIEITESASVTEPDHSRAILQVLHDAGLQIAIDDFGTGYSSLGRLKQMPVDILKIDRSFVSNAHRDPEARIMVQAMVQLAKNLGIRPLAEGVETTEDLAFLRALDCPMGQGFLFSYPVPASEISELLVAGASLIGSPDASTPRPGAGPRLAV
jgi:diguanylate cyclase (GGDEF)-like protein/PAS domain S-box-containing protein